MDNTNPSKMDQIKDRVKPYVVPVGIWTAGFVTGVAVMKLSTLSRGREFYNEIQHALETTGEYLIETVSGDEVFSITRKK